VPNYLSALGQEPRGKKPKKPKASPSHIRARKQEKEVAKRLRGITTPASGAKEMKGDVRVRDIVRIECKTTKNKSFSVTLDMVRKIEDAAIPSGEIPVMLIEFNDGDGNPICEVAVVPSYVLEDLCAGQR
jgi:Holliday junction resolvase